MKISMGFIAVQDLLNAPMLEATMLCLIHSLHLLGCLVTTMHESSTSWLCRFRSAIISTTYLVWSSDRLVCLADLANNLGSRLPSSDTCMHRMQEPCHRLAWTLDACINDKTLDDKRLNSLMAFFAPVDRAGGRPSLSAPPKKRSRFVLMPVCQHCSKKTAGQRVYCMPEGMASWGWSA